MKFSENGISQDVIDVAAAIMRGEKIEEKKKMDPVDKKELKGTHAQRDDKDIDNDGDADASDEYLHNRRKAIKHAMAKKMKEEAEQIDEISAETKASYMKKAGGEIDKLYDKSKTDSRSAYKYYGRKNTMRKIANEEVDQFESVDMDAKNAEKAVKHDCATHVVHKEHGEGRCVPGMHTLEENEDGTGYVTHYDVMFQGEDGPYIVEDCPVEDLEIVQEMSHGHKKKK